MAISGGLGFGIVGAGSIAQTHAAALRAMEGGHLACVYSRSGSERASALASTHGVELHRDVETFLRHPGLDAVIVTTPSGSHLEPAIAAAAARKHVLCEKPLEVSLARCDMMIAACERSSVSLGGVFQSRFAPAALAIRQAILAGRFGSLTLVQAVVPWFRPQSYYDQDEWRGTWALDGGGALMNQAIHTLDLVSWFGGAVRDVSAEAACLAHERIEVEDTVAATLRFASGALGVFCASTAAWPGSPAEILLSGTGGTARLTAGQITQWRFEAEEPGDEALRERLGPSPAAPAGGASDPRAIGALGHQRQLEDFARSIRDGKRIEVDGREARRTVELVLAIYAAAREGRKVILPGPA